MGYWNHRVVKKTDENNNISYSIHEVYYNDDDEPEMFAPVPTDLWSDSLEGLGWQIRQVAKCLTLPVLEEATLNTIGEVALEHLGELIEGDTELMEGMTPEEFRAWLHQLFETGTLSEGPFSTEE